MSVSCWIPGALAGSEVKAILPAPRTVVLASPNAATRARLRQSLTRLHWQVHEAEGGAAALACLEDLRPEALLADLWLPDLEVAEFVECVRRFYPETYLLHLDGSAPIGVAQSPRRHELLQALRELGEDDNPDGEPVTQQGAEQKIQRSSLSVPDAATFAEEPSSDKPIAGFLPEMIGTSAGMAELAQLVRLVAPRSTTVLIEGETGTGKELVAKALHRLSSRANKPFLVLNCAAIPEALLEAELFGHTRGAFTGAVRSRTGRIEAADGGTLFLDEIGEMPLALQAKMLRFLECGELQRVGDNEPTYVDVRVIAATHQPLEQRAEEQAFRLDLYHRLAVFPIEVPALRSRMNDLPLLAEHFLGLLGRGSTVKSLSEEAQGLLLEHHWPGNVRELMHVMERALILAGANPVVEAKEIRIRRRDRSF